MLSPYDKADEEPHLGLGQAGCDCGARAKMECLMCSRLGMKPAPAFCCPDCFAGHWKTKHWRLNRGPDIAGQGSGVPCHNQPRMQFPVPVMDPVLGPIYRNHHLYTQDAMGLWKLQNIAEPVRK